jgi:hypothetical protein
LLTLAFSEQRVRYFILTESKSPDYRFICQEIWRKIQEVHPMLTGLEKFIDWKSYRLGRLQSELRTEYKKSSFE